MLDRSEALLRHKVLGREEPVVAREIDLRAKRHGLAQHSGPEATGDSGHSVGVGPRP